MKRHSFGVVGLSLVLVLAVAGCKKSSTSGPAGGDTSKAWEEAKVKNTKEAYQAYLSSNPSGDRAEEAKALIAVVSGDFASLTPEQMEKLQVVLETNQGTIKFKFYPREAPETVRNFIKLAATKFYDGLIFHRVVAGFVIQGGDPQGVGTGGPGYNIKAEFNSHQHLPGTVAMARSSDPDSAGSQFYFCLNALPMLDNNYTVFGQVTEGMEAVKAIGTTATGQNERPVEPQTMKKVYIEGI